MGLINPSRYSFIIKIIITIIIIIIKIIRRRPFDVQIDATKQIV